MQKEYKAFVYDTKQPHEEVITDFDANIMENADAEIYTFPSVSLVGVPPEEDVEENSPGEFPQEEEGLETPFFLC